ncbi:hypothetical protein ABFJ78_30505 [Amycolatopsis sp. MEPSY49]
MDADAGGVVGPVGQGGQATGRGGGQRADDVVVAGGGQIVAGAGQHRRNPEREPVGAGQELDVAAEGAVLAGVPQVHDPAAVAGCGSDRGRRDPVTRDQGAVGVAGGLALLQDLVQVRGPLIR